MKSCKSDDKVKVNGSIMETLKNCPGGPLLTCREFLDVFSSGGRKGEWERPPYIQNLNCDFPISLQCLCGICVPFLCIYVEAELLKSF